MFGALGAIFGSPKTLGKIVGGVTKGLDALKYTSEEKAHDEQKAIEKAREQVVDFMEATKGQNMARRMIALIIVSIWSLSHGAIGVMAIASVFIRDVELVGKIMEASKLIGEQIQDINTEVILILGFYFGAPHVGEAVRLIQAMKREKK